MCNKLLKRTAAWITAAAMMGTLFTGCSGSKADADTENKSDIETPESGQSADSEDKPQENTAMGRYVEDVMDVSEILDETISVPDEWKKWMMPKYRSVFWDGEAPEWYKDLVMEGNYIASVAYGAEGTIGILYDDDNSNEDIHTVGMIIKPDGTQVPFEIDLPEEEKWLYKIWISDTGRVFASTLRATIYEIKEDGSSEKFLTLDNDGKLEQLEFVGNLMIMDGSYFDGLILYDMEKKEYVEDEVLCDFVNENYEDRDYNTVDCCSMKFFPGEEGVLYLAGEKGLHRHVIGGIVMEQVIDGNLSCLSNPAFLLMGMRALPDNEFLALFSGSRLVHFTYDPDIPTVPDNRLKVYSLEENDLIRQAITIYQSKNPEVYVIYEVGMRSDSSITRDDALKKLNTQIIAGEGPDLLVLDQMPVDSYIEKGMLLDLTDSLSSMEEDQKPFKNIIDAFSKDSKVYMLPCEIRLPFMEGKEAYLSKLDDFEDIADMVEEVRKDNPDTDILGIGSEYGIMRLFSMVSAPAWKTQAGEIDKDVIKDFLYQSKRIYDAQMDGIPEELMEKYQIRNENFLEYYGKTYEDSDFLGMTSWVNIIGNYQQIECGVTIWRSDLTNAFSFSRVKGFEDYTLVPLNGHSKNVFIPKTLVGINAVSNETDKAVEMLKVLFQKDNQTSLFQGLPVTEEGLLEGTFVINPEFLTDEGIYGSYASSDQDGLYLSFEDYWFTEEQKQFVRDWIEKVDTAYVPDLVLEEAVYSEGISYMQGKKSLEEAVNEIEQKVFIYMSE